MPPFPVPNAISDRLSDRGPVSALQESLRTVARAGETLNNLGPVEMVRSELYHAGAGVQMLRYPKNVGIDHEFPHWLKIETHVRESNTLVLSTYRAAKEFVPPEAKSQALDTSARNARIGTLIGGSAGFNIAQQAGGALTRAFPGLSVTGRLLAGTVVPTAAGAVGALAGTVIGALSGPNSYQTLSSVIALGLQEPPKAQYDARWEAQDLGEFVATGSISPVSIAREYIRNKVGLKGALFEAAGITRDGVLGAQELASGKVKNPYKEQLFKGSEFRTFTYTFNFLPDSLAEAKMILDIIKQLRATMLPALDPSGFYLIYPAEYTLTYMYRSEVNTKVHGIGTCVLTNLTTKYGGQDFVTFRGLESSGTPAEFGISMTFREIVPITANQVMEANL